MDVNRRGLVHYKEHMAPNSGSNNLIVKHRHGLVTDCDLLPNVPMIPIALHSAPIESVADVSVKLYINV